MAIYVKFAEEKKPKSIKEFLLKVFSSNCNNRFLRNVETYSNKECTTIQCVKNKYRSFDDILKLIQTYYKSATPKKVFKELLELRPVNNKNNVCKLHMMSCSSIQKINLLYIENNTENTKNYNYICKYPTFNSIYSWKELFQMLNIKNQKDLNNYLKQIDEK